MDDTLFRERAITLEESFFAQQNKELVQRLKDKAEHEERRQALADALQIDDTAVLDRLVELNVSAQGGLAFTIVPLVEVAWADHHLDAKERAAILKAAEDKGMAEGTIARELLEAWLQTEPPTALFDAWKGFVGALKKSLGDENGEKMRAATVERARGVAEAAGGFLGLGSKISGREKAVLEEIERAFA